MQVLRTPDDRFAGLADWPFAPHYAQIRDADGTEMRLAWAEAGPVDGAQGQPHVTLAGSHFLQEDCPEAIVELIDATAKRAR